LFSRAKKRRMINENPIEFTERPKLIDKAPEIFAPAELRALLETASTYRAERSADARHLVLSPVCAIQRFSNLNGVKSG